MVEAGDSSRGTVQVSGNGIGLEMIANKESSDSKTDAPAASFSGGNRDLDEGVDELRRDVGSENGRTGGGHEKVNEIAKELSDSRTELVAKDELVKNSCQVAGSFSDLDAGVSSENGRTGGGHGKVDAFDEGGEGNGMNSDKSKAAKVSKFDKASSYVIEMNFDGGEKVCRICHLSSEGSIEVVAAAPGVVVTSMELIQLGCGCKDELGVAHSHCGEAWFKLKGNRVCEICGETAKNITGVADNMGFMEEWNQMRLIHGTNQSETGGGGGCWRGQPFCNFLMACLVIAFVLPWFFRVNMF